MGDTQHTERGSTNAEFVDRVTVATNVNVASMQGRGIEACEEGHGSGPTQGTGPMRRDGEDETGRRTRGIATCSRHGHYIQGALLLLVLVGLAFVAIASIGFKRGKPTAPDKEPSQADSWDLEDRLYQIKSVLFDALADPSKLFETGSPQAKALNWLVYQDRIITPTGDENLLQRYSLMVFAYATNVELWQVNPQWHTLPAVHECSFPGIDCDEGRRVTNINLGWTKLSGSLPDEIGFLTDLTLLYLPSNGLVGTIPEIMYLMLTNLEQIELGLNAGLSSTISSSISRLHQLKAFHVPRTSLSGTLPQTIARMSNLENVDLFGTYLHGPLFDWISKLTNLESLDISFTRLTGSVPSEIGNLTNLSKYNECVEFLIHPYQELPLEIWTLPNLETLTLHNPLSKGGHVLPTDIGRLHSLNALVLTGYGGRIPTELGMLTTSTALALDNGNLSGEIPSELGRLTGLTILSLRGNELEGSIPVELGNLASNLKTLRVDRNKLEGQLPESFCESSTVVDRDCVVQCECCTHQCRSSFNITV